MSDAADAPIELSDAEFAREAEEVVAEAVEIADDAADEEMDPVEAFRDGGRRVHIDPAVCIDCGSCVGECPLEAIYPEDEVPPAWREFIARNAEMAPRCAAITENKTPLAEP